MSSVKYNQVPVEPDNEQYEIDDDIHLDVPASAIALECGFYKWLSKLPYSLTCFMLIIYDAINKTYLIRSASKPEFEIWEQYLCNKVNNLPKAC